MHSVGKGVEPGAQSARLEGGFQRQSKGSDYCQAEPWKHVVPFHDEIPLSARHRHLLRCDGPESTMSERSLTSVKSVARSVGVRPRVERAAVELFAAKGIDGASIAEIAGAAGVSQGALYRHYRSKEELASTLFAAAYRRTGAELDAIRATQTGFADRVA